MPNFVFSRFAHILDELILCRGYFLHSSVSKTRNLLIFPMRRRKNRVYFSKVAVEPTFGYRPPSSQTESKISYRGNRLPKDSARSSASVNPMLRSVFGHRNLKASVLVTKLRRRLCYLSSVTSVLSLCSSISGLLAVVLDSHRTQTVIFAAICCLSTFQVAFIVFYWTLVIRIADLQNAALAVHFVPSKSLINSPNALTKCLLECVFHLFVPIPGLSSTYLDGFHPNDYLVFLSLMRNYHFVRGFYWFSQFSSMRTLLYARLTTVSSPGGFIFRCCLAAYQFKLILGIYAAMVGLGGIVQAILGHHSGEDSVWSGFWVVAYTLVTIGYGDSSPVSFLPQLAIILGIFLSSVLTGLITRIIFRSLSLDLPEFQYCSSLLSVRHTRQYSLLSIQVIQSWWRLIQSRIRRQPHGPSILYFYSTLRKFRTVLVRANSIQSGLFSHQIQVTGLKLTTEIRLLNTYLYSIQHTNELVGGIQTLNIVRSGYQIKEIAQKVRKFTRRFVSFGENSRTQTEENEAISPVLRSVTPSQLHGKSGLRLAKAKKQAAQSVKARLISEKPV